MQTGSVTCSKRKLTNWWLGAGLLLALLLFAGHSSRTPARYVHPVQIAWQYKRQSSISKQSSWYVQPLYSIKTTAPAAAGDYKHALLYCHRLVSVRLSKSFQIAVSIKITRRLLRIQSFPENPGALMAYS